MIGSRRIALAKPTITIKINVHHSITSYYLHSGFRERNALFRTFFIFYPRHGHNPHEEGSPFVTIIKITSFFFWDLQSRLCDVSVFLLRFSQSKHPIEFDND